MRVLAAAVVFTSPALWEFFHRGALSSIAGADLWWHLQTGLEILRTHSLPHTGWFSQSAAQPWIASSWLYDVKVAIWYQWLGIRFLPLLASFAKLALGIALFVLAGGTRGRFWLALALSLVAQYLLFQMPALPVFWSVLSLAIELILLSEFRYSGRVHWLYFLPFLFLVWANVDFHFVYGVIALLLFAAVGMVQHWGRAEAIGWLVSTTTETGGKTLLAVAAASIAATFITPYGWGSYGVFWANVSNAANAYFPDYLSLRFRGTQDYVLMLLAMAAFLSLGMRRSRELFQVALLVLCTGAAFHSQRDSWLLVLAAVAMIGNPIPEEAPTRELAVPRQAPPATFPLATGISLLILLVFLTIDMPSRDALLAKLAERYPVAAADYIRANHLPAPLFNSYPWGGFLSWYLPDRPVAIDGRTDLYGPDFNVHYAKVMNFEEHYSTFPPLSEAATILLERNSHMAIALATVPGYKTAYSDNVAVVLVRNQDQP